MNREGKVTAIDVPTELVEVNHRQIACRSVGDGPTLILCTRFRGTIDTWDPAFLDELAMRFRVITFDYRGTGKSTGEADYDPKSLAHDVIALADGLDIETFVLGGWSLGGHAAQVVATVWPERVTHLILLGTNPPGANLHSPTPAFSACALKPRATLDDEIVLFFEPMSAESRELAAISRRRLAIRKMDRSPDVPEDLYMKLLQQSSHADNFNDDGGYLDHLERTGTPILVISGDHDIGFPVENWFTLSRKWRSLLLTVLPRSGNGVHHQYPQLVANIISCFVQSQCLAPGPRVSVGESPRDIGSR